MGNFDMGGVGLENFIVGNIGLESAGVGNVDMWNVGIGNVWYGKCRYMSMHPYNLFSTLIIVGQVHTFYFLFTFNGGKEIFTFQC